MRPVILVRHAMPEINRGVANALWPLSESAREDCVLLAHALPSDLAPVVGSSTEPKAADTAAVIALRRGLETSRDPRFGEVDRPSAWDEDFKSAVSRYLLGADHPGWEPRNQVITRFQGALDDLLSQVGDAPGDLVVATHGTALSLWLASVASIDIVPFWRGLTLPDAWRWDPEAGAVTRCFNAGLPNL